MSDDLMVAALLGLAAAAFIAMPLIALIHEGAHALAGARWRTGRIRINLTGATSATTSRSFPGVDVAWKPGIAGSSVVIPGRRAMAPPKQLLIAVAGPLASGAIAGLLVWVTLGSDWTNRLLIGPTALWAAWCTLRDLWPSEKADPHRPGRKLWSDGRVVVDVLSGGPGLPSRD